MHAAFGGNKKLAAKSGLVNLVIDKYALIGNENANTILKSCDFIKRMFLTPFPQNLFTIRPWVHRIVVYASRRAFREEVAIDFLTLQCFS